MKSFSCVGATPQQQPRVTFRTDRLGPITLASITSTRPKGQAPPMPVPTTIMRRSTTPTPHPNTKRTAYPAGPSPSTRTVGAASRPRTFPAHLTLMIFQPASGSRACRMMPRIGPVTGPWARTAVETFALWPTTPILHERSLKVETIPTEFGLTHGTPPQPKWKPEYGNTFSFLPLEERQKSTSTESFRNRRTCRTVQR